MTIQTASWESFGFPRADLTYDTVTGALTVSLTAIDDLVAREVTPEESLAGIDSLSPPTVHAATPRDLVELAKQAVGSAAENAAGGLLSLPDIAFIYYRTATAVKGALDQLELSV